MTLSNSHKLQLLCDLLQNQSTEQYMTDGEAHQIDRLVQSLSRDPNLDPSLLQTIQQIQEQHQLDNRPFTNDVSEWVTSLSINQTT
ncbi:YtzH-like family protein [Alkalihalobacillus sp. FSL W8-0930]